MHANRNEVSRNTSLSLINIVQATIARMHFIVMKQNSFLLLVEDLFELSLKKSGMDFFDYFILVETSLFKIRCKINL